jgi:hypothetical protein
MRGGWRANLICCLTGAFVCALVLVSTPTGAAQQSYSVFDSPPSGDGSLPASVAASHVGPDIIVPIHLAFSDQEHAYYVARASGGRVCLMKLTPATGDPAESAILCAAPALDVSFVDHHDDAGTEDVTALVPDGWVSAAIGSISAPVTGNVVELAGVPEGAGPLTYTAADGTTVVVAGPTDGSTVASQGP